MTFKAFAPLLVAFAAALLAADADAQYRPPASSHEARLLAFYEAPIAFSMNSAAEKLTAGAVRIGAEMIPVPSPSPVLLHPNYCFANTTNNTKLAPLFGRPRLTLGLPAGFAVEASYLPNVTVSAAQANLASIAVTHVESMPFTGEHLSLAVRVDGTAGHVRGAVTCPPRSLQTSDEDIPCYGTRPSRDTFHPNSLGFEAAVATRTVGDRIAFYAGGGARLLHPRFRAGFTDALGNVDHTTIDIDLLRATAFAGVTMQLRDHLSFSTQLYAVPADVTTVRFGAEYALR